MTNKLKPLTAANVSEIWQDSVVDVTAEETMSANIKAGFFTEGGSDRVEVTHHGAFTIAQARECIEQAIQKRISSANLLALSLPAISAPTPKTPDWLRFWSNPTQPQHPKPQLDNLSNPKKGPPR